MNRSRNKEAKRPLMVLLSILKYVAKNGFVQGPLLTGGGSRKLGKNQKRETDQCYSTCVTGKMQQEFWRHQSIWYNVLKGSSDEKENKTLSYALVTFSNVAK